MLVIIPIRGRMTDNRIRPTITMITTATSRESHASIRSYVAVTFRVAAGKRDHT